MSLRARCGTYGSYILACESTPFWQNMMFNIFNKVTGIDRVRIVPVLVQRSHGKKHGKVWQSDGVPSLQEIIMQNF